jgi:long-chain acyl-CoA synthetase
METRLRSRNKKTEEAAPLLPIVDEEAKGKGPAVAMKPGSSTPFTLKEEMPFVYYFYPTTWILYLIDFTCWIVTFGWLQMLMHAMKGKVSSPASASVVEVAHEVAKDGTVTVKYLTTFDKEAVRQRYAGKPLDTTPFPGCATAYDLMERAFKEYAEKEAVGTRTYVGDQKKGKIVKKVFTDTKWKTYAEFGERCHQFGAGLRNLGQVPFHGDASAFEAADKVPNTVLLYEDTSEGWSTAAVGSFTQSLVVATSYATLGIEAVALAINQTSCTVVVCNYKKAALVCRLKSKCPSLKTVIYTTLYATPEEIAKGHPEADVPGVKLLSQEEVITLGKEKPVAVTRPHADDIAVLMYTSGSTGTPKGVMLSHGNITATVQGINDVCPNLVHGEETYLAYLPAAHILELTAEMMFMSIGSRIGYADPRSISSKGAMRKNPDGELCGEKPEHIAAGFLYPPGAIQEFKPTVMAAVPKIWDTLKKGAEEAIAKKSTVVKYLLQVAYSVRSRSLKMGTDCPVFALLFKTFKSMLGGRLKFVLSGGGPISSGTQTFVRTCMCQTFVQGYGLTETNAASCIQLMDDYRDGVVGPPLSTTEIALADCYEPNPEGDRHNLADVSTPPQKMAACVEDSTKAPYLGSDRTHRAKTSGGIISTGCLGRGEVWIRGPTVSKGYYKMPDKTKESYIPSENGTWFRTGDIAMFTADGVIKIVDRLKNLVKLIHGEYIAIENMEKEFAKCPYISDVAGGIMAYGDGTMGKPVALVQVDIHKIKTLAEQLGITTSKSSTEEEDWELCQNSSINTAVLGALKAAGKSGLLSPVETLCAVVLLPGTGSDSMLTKFSPWTPDNKGLTASNKLNRKDIVEALEGVMEELKTKGR